MDDNKDYQIIKSRLAIHYNHLFFKVQANMKLRHCLLSDTESETYLAQYTISYDVINKRKKLSNLTLLQTGQPSHNLSKLLRAQNP